MHLKKKLTDLKPFIIFKNDFVLLFFKVLESKN